MHRRLRNTLVLTAAVAAASGCGDQQQQLPSAPEYHTITGTSSGCDFTHINQLVNSYFTNPQRQKTVRDLVSAMAAADGVQHFSTTVKSNGFDIMANIAAVVVSTTAGDLAGNSGVGSNLVNHLILCMYDPVAEKESYPTTFPEDFTVALDTSAHGAFAVKPPTNSVTDANADAVLSRPTSAPFSGVGPSTGTWAGALSTNTPARVLLYGRPVTTNPKAYDWKTVPHNASFSPPVVVAVCVNALTATTTLVNEQNVGLLPFVDAPFLVPGTCSETALLDQGSPAMLARRLIRLGASLFGPHALWATALCPGGTGGLTGGIRSEFGPTEIDSVHLQFVQQPTSTKVNTFITSQGGGPVTILATAFSGGVGKTIPNVSIGVAAVNNNGSTVSLSGTTTQITNGSGIATYANLSLNKTGGYKLVTGNSHVGNRPDILVGTAASAKFNIAPK